MDGYEVRAQLGHLDPGGVRPPVIAVTAYGTDADYLRTWSADFDAHVTKPVDYDLLLAVILRTLAARPRLRRARRVPPGRRGPSGRAT
jgi:two-component system CheB/CheR fusion protein